MPWKFGSLCSFEVAGKLETYKTGSGRQELVNNVS